MKFYIASRTKNREVVKEFQNLLESKGHEISYKWTDKISPEIFPYEKNQEISQKHAEEIAKAILYKTDIFILISDAEGTDMYLEMGIAIASHLTKNKPRKIYSVGKYNKRSLMQNHPSIIHKNSLEEVLAYEQLL